jgi:hypothetical protein
VHRDRFQVEADVGGLHRRAQRRHDGEMLGQGGEVYYANPYTLGLRTPTGLHRYLRGFHGAMVAVVLAGRMGALALINEEIYRVGTPKLTPTDGRGAGDSMTAGVAAVLARGGEMSEAVRTGAAAGTLNVTRHGLGTGHLDAVQVLTERIRLTPIKKAR